MKKTISTTANILNWVVLLAMLAVIVLHVMPYWHYEGLDIVTLETSEKTASIQGYVWRSFDHLDLEDGFSRILKSQKLTTKYWINDYIMTPILAFLPAAAGIILCVLKRKSWLAGVAPVVSGAAGVLAFTSNPILVNSKILDTYGNASFMTPSLGLIASIVVLALGIALLALRLVEKFVFGKKKAAA